MSTTDLSAEVRYADNQIRVYGLQAATTTLDFTLNIAPAKAPPPLPATAVTPVSQNVDSPPSGANLEPTAERWKPPCASVVVETKQYQADSLQAATPSVHGACAGYLLLNIFFSELVKYVICSCKNVILKPV